MFKKCKANCQANDNLYMRNGVFYYMVELPRQDGKRRYFIKSLHTKDYYDALENAKNMKKEMELAKMNIKQLANRAQELMDRIVFDTVNIPVDNGDGRMAIIQQQRVSIKTDIKVVEELYDIVVKMLDVPRQKLDAEDIEIITKILSITIDSKKAELLETLQSKIVELMQAPPTPNSNHTINYVLESWIKSLNNCETEIQRKKNSIIKMITSVGLRLTDKYMDFYKAEIIQQICENIRYTSDVKGNTKRKYARYLKEFIMHANILNPVAHKTELINLIPSFEKTPSSDVDGHMPYTPEQLKLIFNIENDYFNKHEDQFWFAIIALFTGARRNAATTLQYTDIIETNDIKCIQFKETHPIKNLKTEESERIVPVAQQMLDLGFWEYINRRKKRLNATDTDFIFPNCQRQDGAFNTNIVQKGFIKHITELGIKQKGGEKYDFHSLRNNASLRLQDVGVSISYINKIIGWKGETTMETNYSKRRLYEIKDEVDKLRYDFLQPEFDYWKIVMTKK